MLLPLNYLSAPPLNSILSDSNCPTQTSVSHPDPAETGQPTHFSIKAHSRGQPPHHHHSHHNALIKPSRIVAQLLLPVAMRRPLSQSLSHTVMSVWKDCCFTVSGEEVGGGDESLGEWKHGGVIHSRHRPFEEGRGEARAPTVQLLTPTSSEKSLFLIIIHLTCVCSLQGADFDMILISGHVGLTLSEHMEELGQV